MTNMTFLPETSLAIEAAIKAGATVAEVYADEFTCTFKDNKEPLTIADTKSNEIIQAIISRSGYPILSEESTDNKNRLGSSRVWIVDPLDGTADFIKKMDEFSMMIALVENNKPILGVVYKPIGNVLYTAEAGKGAYVKSGGCWLSLKVSRERELKKCRAIVSRQHLAEEEKEILNSLGIAEFKQ